MDVIQDNGETWIKLADHQAALRDVELLEFKNSEENERLTKALKKKEALGDDKTARRDIAISMLPAIYSSDSMGIPPDVAVDLAVDYADRLVAALK